MLSIYCELITLSEYRLLWVRFSMVVPLPTAHKFYMDYSIHLIFSPKYRVGAQFFYLHSLDWKYELCFHCLVIQNVCPQIVYTNWYSIWKQCSTLQKAYTSKKIKTINKGESLLQKNYFSARQNLSKVSARVSCNVRDKDLCQKLQGKVKLGL
jgi:hypothetical protein